MKLQALFEHDPTNPKRNDRFITIDPKFSALDPGGQKITLGTEHEIRVRNVDDGIVTFTRVGDMSYLFYRCTLDAFRNGVITKKEHDRRFLDDLKESVEMPQHGDELFTVYQMKAYNTRLRHMVTIYPRYYGYVISTTPKYVYFKIICHMVNKDKPDYVERRELIKKTEPKLRISIDEFLDKTVKSERELNKKFLDDLKDDSDPQVQG